MMRRQGDEAQQTGDKTIGQVREDRVQPVVERGETLLQAIGDERKVRVLAAFIVPALEDR
jgi:hypothetical protein